MNQFTRESIHREHFKSNFHILQHLNQLKEALFCLNRFMNLRIDSQHLSHRIRTFVNPFMNRRTKTLVNLFIETGYLWDYSWIYSWNDQYEQTQFFNIRFNPMTNIGCLCIKYQYISCNAWIQFYWASHSIIIGDLTGALYKLKTILF